MKDPAFLFYFRDFKSSTENMTNCQRGAYIQLMCIQAENGYISDKDMIKICSVICYNTMTVKLDQDTYEAMKSKFSEEEPGSGRFINKRLSEEIQKRAKYCESRRNNKIQSKKQENKTSHVETQVRTYDKHMTSHMVNANINENENREIKGVQGEKERPHHTEVHDPKNGQFVKTKTNDVSQLVPHPSDQSGRVQYEIVAMNHSWSYPKLTEVWETWVASRQSNEDKRFNRTEAFADFRKFCLSYAANERSKNKNGNHSKPTGKIIYAEPD